MTITPSQKYWIETEELIRGQRRAVEAEVDGLCEFLKDVHQGDLVRLRFEEGATRKAWFLGYHRNIMDTVVLSVLGSQGHSENMVLGCLSPEVWVLAKSILTPEDAPIGHLRFLEVDSIQGGPPRFFFFTQEDKGKIK